MGLASGKEDVLPSGKKYLLASEKTEKKDVLACGERTLVCLWTDRCSLCQERKMYLPLEGCACLWKERFTSL